MAKLKALVKDLADVPEAYRDSYTKTDDGYVLDVDGSDYKTRLDEFRSNNRALSQREKELVAQAQRFEGVDPEKYKASLDALEKINQMEDAELIKSGKWEEIIKKRTSTMEADFTKKMTAAERRAKAAEEEREALRGNYHGLLVETSVAKAVGSAGRVRPGAMQDVINRAKATWKVNDKGELVAPDKFNAKGDPITVDEWAKSLVTEAPYFFEPGQGGGASGGNKGNGGANGPKVIDGRDHVAFGKNLEAIAKGEVIVKNDRE